MTLIVHLKGTSHWLYECVLRDGTARTLLLAGTSDAAVVSLPISFFVVVVVKWL